MADMEEITAELDRLRSENQALKEIISLRSENEGLRKTAAQGLSLKVSEKGGLSVYGLGRFPVTLYREQWLWLLAMADDIRGFMETNRDRLKSR